MSVETRREFLSSSFRLVGGALVLSGLLPVSAVLAQTEADPNDAQAADGAQSPDGQSKTSTPVDDSQFSDGSNVTTETPTTQTAATVPQAAPAVITAAPERFSLLLPPGIDSIRVPQGATVVGDHISLCAGTMVSGMVDQARRDYFWRVIFPVFHPRNVTIIEPDLYDLQKIKEYGVHLTARLMLDTLNYNPQAAVDKFTRLAAQANQLGIEIDAKFGDEFNITDPASTPEAVADRFLVPVCETFDHLPTEVQNAYEGLVLPMAAPGTIVNGILTDDYNYRMQTEVRKGVGVDFLRRKAKGDAFCYAGYLNQDSELANIYQNPDLLWNNLRRIIKTLADCWYLDPNEVRLASTEGGAKDFSENLNDRDKAIGWMLFLSQVIPADLLKYFPNGLGVFVAQSLTGRDIAAALADQEHDGALRSWEKQCAIVRLGDLKINDQDQTITITRDEFLLRAIDRHLQRVRDPKRGEVIEIDTSLPTTLYNPNIYGDNIRGRFHDEPNLLKYRQIIS